MKPAEAYSLRMALLNAGHIPVPCRDRKPVMILQSAPSEGCVRSWATLHEHATDTGIVVGDQVTIVGSLEDAGTATMSAKEWLAPPSAKPPKACARSEPPPSPSASQNPGQRAGVFLADHLAQGPRFSADVIEAAKAEGISIITLRRAKLALGIVAEPVKSNGYAIDRWVWRLPGKSQIESDDHLHAEVGC